jgi:hypothetical protein
MASGHYAPDAGTEAESQPRLRHRLSANTADGYAEAGFTAVVEDVVLGDRLTAYIDLFRTHPPGGGDSRGAGTGEGALSVLGCVGGRVGGRVDPG